MLEWNSITNKFMSVYFKTFTNGKNFLLLWGRTTPLTVSPVSNNLIWDVDNKYHLVMQIIIIRRTQETIAISHHFKNTFTFYYSIKFKVRIPKITFLSLKLGFDSVCLIDLDLLFLTGLYFLGFSSIILTTLQFSLFSSFASSFFLKQFSFRKLIY
jgi:hypothetical protein